MIDSPPTFCHIPAAMNKSPFTAVSLSPAEFAAMQAEIERLLAPDPSDTPDTPEGDDYFIGYLAGINSLSGHLLEALTGHE